MKMKIVDQLKPVTENRKCVHHVTEDLCICCTTQWPEGCERGYYKVSSFLVLELVHNESWRLHTKHTWIPEGWTVVVLCSLVAVAHKTKSFIKSLKRSASWCKEREEQKIRGIALQHDTVWNRCCIRGGELKISMTLVAASDLPAVTALTLTNENREYQNTNICFL